MNGNNKENNAVMLKNGAVDIVDQRNFARELQSIENNQAMGFTEKYKAKRQLMKSVLTAKQLEINHRLESYQNYLLAKKDVEAKSISLEAQKAVLQLEKQQIQMMKDLGLDHSAEISNTLIKAGNLLTEQLNEAANSRMEDEVKAMTIENIRKVWNRTNEKIMESLDTYMEELYIKNNKHLV